MPIEYNAYFLFQRHQEINTKLRFTPLKVVFELLSRISTSTLTRLGVDVFCGCPVTFVHCINVSACHKKVLAGKNVILIFYL